METLILEFVAGLSLVIGLIGILVIAVGALRGLYQYLVTPDTHNFQSARLVLGSHIILGLDFMVGKDIIDTLLLDSGSEFWQDLTSLITVVAIRIILTHFMLEEIRGLKAAPAPLQQKSKKR